MEPLPAGFLDPFEYQASAHEAKVLGFRCDVS